MPVAAGDRRPRRRQRQRHWFQHRHSATPPTSTRGARSGGQLSPPVDPRRRHREITRCGGDDGTGSPQLIAGSAALRTHRPRWPTARVGTSPTPRDTSTRWWPAAPGRTSARCTRSSCGTSPSTPTSNFRPQRPRPDVAADTEMSTVPVDRYCRSGGWTSPIW